MSNQQVIQGDCLEVMKTLEENSVDAIVTDPPYGLSFMGKKWDYDVPSQEIWEECLRVLKPGGYLLSFAGTRTQHRMAVRIEDAGFEIRDMIAWVYGSGFPKSLNIGKAVDKLAGRTSEDEIAFVKWLKSNQTKPYEEIDSSLGTNSQAFHYFAESNSNRQIPSNEHYKIIKELLSLNDDYDQFIKEKNRELKDIREIEGYENGIKTWDKKYQKPILNKPVSDEAKVWEGWGTALKPALEPITVARKPLSEKTVAENVLKWGTGGINIDSSRIPSYTNDDNSENIVLSHKLSELRGKLHTLLFSCEVGKKDSQILSNDDGYVQNWKELQGCLGDCLTCRGLYDGLSPLFLKGDQVSVQQLHDALSHISHYQSKQSDTLCSQCKFRLSNLDDLNQLVLSYSNDTTLYIQKQEKLGRPISKREEASSVNAYNWSKYKNPLAGQFIDNTGGLGRFPANFIHDGSDEVVELFPNNTGAMAKVNKGQKGFGGVIYGKYAQAGDDGATFYNDGLGSAARFFYCAKASKSERNKGCEGLEEKQYSHDGREKPIENAFQRNKSVATNNHPTVKPIALMEYLVKLVSKEGAVVLDPFAGSGSTLVACKKLKRNYLGIELNPEYIKIAESRLAGIPDTLF